MRSTRRAGRTRTEVIITPGSAVEESFANAAERLGTFTENLDIAGTGIRVVFAGEAMHRALMPALAHARCSALEPVATVLAYDCLFSRVAPPVLPWRAEDVGSRGEIALDDPDLRAALFVPSGCLSTYDARRRMGVFAVPAASSLPAYERAAPLRTLLHWILSDHGCHLVHAAAVGAGRGAALLAGRGGSGKSTSALLCARAGMQFLGDDYVGIGTGEVHSLFATAKVDERAAAMLPGLSLEVRPAGDEKGFAVVSDVARSLPVRVILLPRVSEGKSAVAGASRAEALRALAPTTLFQLPGKGTQAFAALAELARSTPALHLTLGRDFDRIPQLIARTLEGNA